MRSHHLNADRTPFGSYLHVDELSQRQAILWQPIAVGDTEDFDVRMVVEVGEELGRQEEVSASPSIRSDWLQLSV